MRGRKEGRKEGKGEMREKKKSALIPLFPTPPLLPPPPSAQPKMVVVTEIHYKTDVPLAANDT